MRLFNIPHNDNNNSAISSTVYQSNLKYSLCFKRPRDHCGVSTEEWRWRCLISDYFNIIPDPHHQQSYECGQHQDRQ